MAAASWVEQSAEDRVEDQAEILVYHYSEALALVEAAGEERPEIEASLVRFLLLAGDRAMGLDIPAAEAAYRRALGTCPTTTRSGRTCSSSSAMRCSPWDDWWRVWLHMRRRSRLSLPQETNVLPAER